MNLRLFKPIDALLQQHIDYFYILEKSEDSENVRYYTFPHYNSIVSINQYPEFVFGPNRLLVKKNQDNPILSTLICGYTKPIEIIIPGFIHEITISFKPLGLNAFLEQDLCSYTSDSFIYFDPFEDFLPTMQKIMDEKNDGDKISLLEAYLATKYKGFSHLFLHGLIADLLDFDNNYSIAELADKYGITRKTIYKHFKRYFIKTPSELKKVARFRKVMEQRNLVDGNNRFTDITYTLDFFDQSHLIKDFKSITGYTPKAFFNHLRPQENGDINWLYL